MFTVAINDVHCFAYAGTYPQETKLKNELVFNVSASLRADIDKLPVIDYEWLYAIVKQSIAEPVRLLEDIVRYIIKAIQQAYPGAIIKASVRKLNPPFGGEAAAEVCYETIPA